LSLPEMREVKEESLSALADFLPSLRLVNYLGKSLTMKLLLRLRAEN
jgi:hypothetical protein